MLTKQRTQTLTLAEWRARWDLLGWPAPWWTFEPWLLIVAIVELVTRRKWIA